nr:hypothetical protein [Gemmatimonadota bacterium]
AWAATALNTDADIASIIDDSLASRIGKLKSEDKMALREYLSSRNVPVFALLTDTARQNASTIRLLVTRGNGGTPDQLAEELGYDANSADQAFLADPDAPHRAMSVKVAGSLVLEKAFPWLDELRVRYERIVGYNPHLWLDGRIRVRHGTAESELKREFSIAIAFGVLLRTKSTARPQLLAECFTSRLEREATKYLSDGTVAIRNRRLFVLTELVPESALTGDGKIEWKLGPEPFLEIPGPGDYGAAYAAFLQRPILMQNAKLMNKWLGGVTRRWEKGQESPTLVVPKGFSHERANRFLELLPDAIAPLEALHRQLQDKPNPSASEGATKDILAWVLTELSREQTELRATIDESVL